MKFKVGDVVECLSKEVSWGSEQTWEVGDVFTIESITEKHRMDEGKIIAWDKVDIIGVYFKDLKLYNPTADDYNKMCFKL